MQNDFINKSFSYTVMVVECFIFYIACFVSDKYRRGLRTSLKVELVSCVYTSTHDDSRYPVVTFYCSLLYQFSNYYRLWAKVSLVYVRKAWGQLYYTTILWMKTHLLKESNSVERLATVAISNTDTLYKSYTDCNRSVGNKFTVVRPLYSCLHDFIILFFSFKIYAYAYVCTNDYLKFKKYIIHYRVNFDGEGCTQG